MFEIKEVENKLTLLPKDVKELEKTIKGFINSIADDKLFLDLANRDFVIEILKRIVVREIDKSDEIEIEKNKGYIVKVFIDNEEIRFSMSKVENDKLGKGYIIELTLQG